MIQLGQLNKENLTVKKGMFTKKLTVEDEAKFPVTENTNIRLTGFTLEESLVEEGICFTYPEDNFIVFKLKPTLVCMNLFDSSSTVKYWTDTAYFAYYEGSLWLRITNNKLPFFITNVYLGSSTLHKNHYMKLCVGTAWNNMPHGYKNFLKDPKSFILKFLETAPNTDLSFRRQFEYISATHAQIRKYYRKLENLQKDIKTVKEAKLWYRKNGNSWYL